MTEEKIEHTGNTANMNSTASASSTGDATVDSLDSTGGYKFYPMDIDDKAISSSEIVGSYVPFGVTTFAELEDAKDAQASAQTVEMLADQFASITRNIFSDSDIENKAAAISGVVGELEALLGEATSKEVNKEAVEIADRDDVLKAVWSTKKVNGFPDSSFLHVLPGGEKNGSGKTVPRSLRMFPYKDASGKVDLPHLRNALARIPQSNRIDGATKSRLTAKARKILKAQSKEADGLLDRITDTVKNWFGEGEVESVDKPAFTLWKEADTLRWAAWFSNNYRDDDNPPEIISADAHRDFVKAVDSGEWPKPELWFWHFPPAKFGQVDLVAYAEDTGFTLAAGTIDKGKEDVAQYCADNGYRVSHGMPSETIERDLDDPTVITRYRTKEVSFLPADAAANKFTSLALKEDSMELPEKKLAELEAAGFDVEALVADLKASAEAEGRESKEVESEEEAVETETVESEVETKTDETVEVKTEVETVEEAEPATFTEPQMHALADAFSTAMAPLMERLEALEAEPTVEEKEEDDKQLELPSNFLGQLLHSRVIGSDVTRVDGRTKEAHDKPKEVDNDDAGVRLAHPMAEQTVNRLLTGATFRELQEQTQ
jgi:hypothetical protein